MKFKFFHQFIFIYSIILIFSLCIFIPIFTNYGYITNYTPIDNLPLINISNTKLTWPIPGYTTITSKFGYRKPPTNGASSFHSGIDIGAPTNSNIVSVCDGTVVFAAFKGAGGYTITIKNNNFTFSYCHVSPNFLVHVGQFVNKGSLIAKVGPKNVYGVPNNPYKDKYGNPTNGATTRFPFTSYYKKRRQSR